MRPAAHSRLHLASLHFRVEQGLPVALASYDVRLLDAAHALRLPLHPLPEA